MKAAFIFVLLAAIVAFAMGDLAVNATSAAHPAHPVKVNAPHPVKVNAAHPGKANATSTKAPVPVAAATPAPSSAVSALKAAVLNGTVADSADHIPRKTPGVACSTQTTCGGCFSLHTCVFTKTTHKCIESSSPLADKLRAHDQLLDACPTTVLLGRQPIVLPGTPITHDVLPVALNDGPEDPFEVAAPVIATPEVVAALAPGTAVPRVGDFSEYAFAELDADAEVDLDAEADMEAEMTLDAEAEADAEADAEALAEAEAMLEDAEEAENAEEVDDSEEVDAETEEGAEETA